jgi:hypothetical protein
MKAPAENIGVIYQQMVRWANWMGVARLPWQTPYEHAALLQRSLPGYEREVGTITDGYVRDTFSRPHLASTNSRSAAQFSAALENNRTWSRLRAEMLRRAIKRRLPSWLGGDG